MKAFSCARPPSHTLASPPSRHAGIHLPSVSASSNSVAPVVAIPPPRVAATITTATAAVALSLQLLISPLSAEARWDGESAALGSCPLGDAGIECRKATIARDNLGSYSRAIENATKIGGQATGVPISNLGSEYAKDTVALGSSIDQYINGDVYDDARPALVKSLKTQGATWVSKYARGGSARTLSARRFYIAVDAVEGHLASNGFAPFPKNKIPKVQKDVTDALELLTEGK